MTTDIVKITKEIYSIGFDISPGWPSFARWIKSQLPLRDIIGYESKNYSYNVGYSDKFKSEGLTGNRCTHEYHEAVLSKEIEGLLMAPPFNMEREKAREYRHHLEETGLLVKHLFGGDYQNVCGESINQFRL